MRLVFVGAYGYAQAVLDAMPRVDLVITNTIGAPMQQRLSWPSSASFIDVHGDHVERPILASLGPDDLVVVAGWRRLVPVSAPTVGFHSAKLPQYPGRAPVAHAILRADTTLTNTMLWLTDSGVPDDGDIIDERTFPIGSDPEAIYEDIGRTSAEMLTTHWAGLLTGDAPRTPQDMALRGEPTSADGYRWLDELHAGENGYTA